MFYKSLVGKYSTAKSLKFLFDFEKFQRVVSEFRTFLGSDFFIYNERVV